jgi:hypothetical protein
MPVIMISEVLTTRKGEMVIITDSHFENYEEAVKTFESRCNTLKNAVNVKKVLKYDFDVKNNWGAIRVELDKGGILEITMMETYLV